MHTKLPEREHVLEEKDRAALARLGGIIDSSTDRYLTETETRELVDYIENQLNVLSEEKLLYQEWIHQLLTIRNQLLGIEGSKPYLQEIRQRIKNIVAAVEETRKKNTPLGKFMAPIRAIFARMTTS